MAKTGGYASGGVIHSCDLQMLINGLGSAVARIRDKRLMELLDTEEATIRYQEVILGIERRWDRLMRYREGRSHRVRQWDRHGNLVKSEYFDKY